MKNTHGRVWEAASTDPSRPALTGVWFDAENATLTATDSYMLARVPCEVEEGDESGLIPAVALKTAFGRKPRKNQPAPSLRVAAGEATLERWSRDGTYQERLSWKLLDAERFPDIEKIVSDLPAPIEQPFRLNPAFVARIGRALGCDNTSLLPIALHPTSPRRPIRVMAGTRPEQFGAIMPVRLFPGDQVERAEPQPDWSNPDVAAAAASAMVDALNRRRGKKKAHDAFMRAAETATADAKQAARKKAA